MGLDAFVSCNCYKEGKTTPFPVPELEKFFRFGDYGEWEMMPPYDMNDEIYDWMVKGACEHELMWEINERLSNWSGYRAFQEALAQIGWHHFPVLQSELPESNGGLMLPESSAKVLRELEYFKTEADFGTKFSLFDLETGEVIHDYIEAYQGIFIWAGKSGFDLGVNPEGFFVQTHPTEKGGVPTILFRAKRFEQRFLNGNENEQVEFYDADSESRFRSPVAIIDQIPWPDGRWQNDAGQSNYRKPSIMHVAERVVGADEYDYIVQPLIRLCKASIETGNPVVWC